MLVLAIDSASHLCSAAVFDSGQGTVLGRSVEDIGRGHAERMMAVIDAAVRGAGVELRSLGRIAVTIGPGSFTGIRVGVATARGLALALGVPVVGVGVLDAIAAGAAAAGPAAQPVMAVLDARRGEIFAQMFAPDGEPLSPAAAITAEAAAEAAKLHGAVLVGSGAPLVAEHWPETMILGTSAAADIEVVARIGAALPEGAPPAPLYLRAPDAKPQAGFVLPRRSGAQE